MTPTARTWWLLFAASFPVALTAVLPLPISLALIPTIVSLGLALADRLGGSRQTFEIERKCAQVLSVGVENKISIEVRNRSSRRMTVEVGDEYPEFGTADPYGGILRVRLAPYKSSVESYSFTPSRRGRHQFEGIQVRYASRFGFWSIFQHVDAKQEVQVFPNIEALNRYELLARVNNLDEFGVRTVRMKGEGTEFERLRDYRMGDEPRKVDWKATKRFNKLIVREMGQERNQNILIMIDMGRMMRQTTDGISHFDYALNTSIILAHIAQNRGDNVGAVFFSDRVQRFVPLGRGNGTVEAIVHAGYDLEPEPVATNYTNLFRHVTMRVRKRSMLLMLTHFVPGEDNRLVRSFMQLLGRKHLPMCLFFQEPQLEKEVQRVPSTTREAYHRAAAADILLERKESLAGLRHAGVMAVDALPGELSAEAISSYLDVKARNLL